VGCGGVTTGADVLEYMLAGASAVEIGTTLLAEPRAGARITRELRQLAEREGITSVYDLVGRLEPW
jgi:dihydroorotate dehydrogenase (NAD+) catalytic subunit